MTTDLSRFAKAQAPVIDRVLGELRAGRKQSHWMWYVFPQLAALGRSEMAQFYGIGDLAEARAYLADPVLRERLIACTEALLPWAGERSAEAITGGIDAVKLKSSMTLFEAAGDADGLFGRCLDLFYGGDRDEATLRLLKGA